MSSYRFVRRAVYNLKREYPISVTFIRESDANPDWDTGSVGKSSIEIEIPRAVNLPKEILRDNATFGAYLFGSDLPEAERVILIDVNDLPSDIPEPELSKSKIRVEGKVWETSGVKNFFGVAYQFTLKEVS